MICTTDIAGEVRGRCSDKSSRLLLLDSLCSGEQPIEEAIFENE